MRKGGPHKITHTHTYAERERGEQPGTCARLVAGRGEREWGRRSFEKKRINIDRFWKVGRRARRTGICSRSQDARWEKKKKKTVERLRKQQNLG